MEKENQITENTIGVAVYLRVEKADANEITSVELLKSKYMAMIKANPAWEYCGIYIDEGFYENEAFEKMAADAFDGKFRLVITMCVRRFTLKFEDCLACIRKLKSANPPVGIYFEREFVNTLDDGAEKKLTEMESIRLKYYE